MLPVAGPYCPPEGDRTYQTTFPASISGSVGLARVEPAGDPASRMVPGMLAVDFCGVGKMGEADSILQAECCCEKTVGCEEMPSPDCDGLIIGGEEDGLIGVAGVAEIGMRPEPPSATFCEAGLTNDEEAAAIDLKAASSSFELLRVLSGGIRNLAPQYGQMPFLPA